jgi:hypothetical protein
MEGALPAEASKSLVECRHQLEQEGRLAAFRPFLHGGFWDGFLVKYAESNQMHKRMLDVSERIAHASIKGQVSEARELLWRAQANDAYWHGLFGGLYLSNLRHETYRNLIAAEDQLDRAAHAGDPHPDWLDLRVMDLDKDGDEEVLIATTTLGLCLAPAYGGSLVELDYRPAQFNLLNVLTRRPEAYHEKLSQASTESESRGGPPKPIHELKVKEPGLDRMLLYDRHRRVSLLDRFLDLETSWEALDRIDEVERGNCVGGRYRLDKPQIKSGTATVNLSFTGTVRLKDRTIPIQIRKVYRVSAGREQVTVSYELTNQGQEVGAMRFGIEWNLTLLAGDDPQRYYEWPGGEPVRLRERGGRDQIEWFSMVDEWHRFRVTFRLDRPEDIWYAPIETISQSEDGFERTYQGSAILTSCCLFLHPGRPERLEARLDISEL